MRRLFAPRRLLAAVLLCFATSSPAGESAPVARTFSVGIVPQQSATKLLHAWGPLLALLGERTGHRFEFKTAPDIPTFEARLASGEYDFAYMNPFHFTVFNETAGYRALARARDKRIRGVLVVAADSGIDTIEQLNGETLAFPAPAAFAATLLIRGQLEQRGIEVGARFVNSHDSVYRAVDQGLFPAGGGVQRTFGLMDASVRDNLRILWKTDGYTPHAVASHPRIDDAVRDQLLAVLSSLDLEGASAPVLEGLGIKGFVAARDTDWDDVRSLSLSTLLAKPE